jgi:two-component system alkaline phosphatase synthesis response regulator PhoP
MRQTILVIDDEKDITDLLKYNLEKEGFRVLVSHNGKAALGLLSEQPAVILLDVMMPGMDGWEVCRAIRSNPKFQRVPIIFLTARDSEMDEVLGLELGASDYITKPVRLRTLLTRIKKALKSTTEPQDIPASDVLTFGDLSIHAQNYLVTMGKKEIFFPKKEFEVLLYLARHPNRVISRETLLNQVWGENVVVVDRTVDVHIRKIREKLGRYASHIETVKGVGYRFTTEP